MNIYLRNRKASYNFALIYTMTALTIRGNRGEPKSKLRNRLPRKSDRHTPQVLSDLQEAGLVAIDSNTHIVYITNKGMVFYTNLPVSKLSLPAIGILISLADAKDVTLQKQEIKRAVDGLGIFLHNESSLEQKLFILRDRGYLTVVDNIVTLTEKGQEVTNFSLVLDAETDKVEGGSNP